MAYRIGMDIGGTFTDLAVADDAGEFHMYKSPTTPQNHTQGIIDCLKLYADDLEMTIEELAHKVGEFIVHGSTVATNAVIERKGAKVGMICTKGFRHLLWRRDGNKQDVFNFFIPYPRPLVPPYLCLEVNERINSEGGVEVPLEEDDVRAAIRQLKEWKVEAIGVSLLWSISNDSHELRIGQIIKEEWPEIPFSLGSQLQPIIGEYNRMSCVAFDAMLKPIMRHYALNLRESLAKHKFEKDIFMVTSSGGIMTIDQAIQKPVYCLFSGPSMGPTAGLFFAQQENSQDCVIIDMGGTSFDVSAVMDGKATLTRNARVDDCPTGVTSVEVLTLGAGGGSIGWVDPGGLIHVGPHSAGAEPGPACYGIGGRDPTVTDANVVLGYINPDYFLGGRMKIYPNLSHETLEEKIAKPLNQGIEDAAIGVHRVANENMVGGILDMTVRRGIDPREFLLVVGGGAGGIHAAKLAKELNMKRLLIPRMAPVLCALGMLNADINFSYVGSKYTDTTNFDYDGVNTLLTQLEAKAKADLEREGIPTKNQRFEYYVAARYPMQVHAIDLPLKQKRLESNMIPQLVEDFHAIHKKLYAANDPMACVECTDWRVVGTGVLPRLQLTELPSMGEDASLALKGRRDAYFEEENGFVTTRIYDGNKLGHGMKINGPAIIEDPLTTVVVIPDCTVTINKVGAYNMWLS